MFQNKVALRSITGKNCLDLTLVLHSIECKGDGNSGMECPDIRLKKSNVLKDLMIDNGDLNICFGE